MTHSFKRIAVYCGSNYGSNPAYFHAAKALAKALSQQSIGMVYGGGKIGLMGVMADEMLKYQAEVIGVIPTFLKQKEVAHMGLTQLIDTPDMTTRKTKMIELADGFIALAGGLGTFEELFEVLSLLQLQQHNKPVGVLNINGFFDPVIAMLKNAANEGFMPLSNMDLLCVSDDANTLLKMMANFRFEPSVKWVKPDWLNQSDDTTHNPTNPPPFTKS